MSDDRREDRPRTWPFLSFLVEKLGGLAVLRVEPGGEGEPPTISVLAGATAFGPELGAVIRSRRQQCGMTLADLAPLAGMNVPTLSRMERGKKAIKLGALNLIARALGVEPEELIREAAYQLVATHLPHLREGFQTEFTITFPHLGAAILGFLDRVVELDDGNERRAAWRAFRTTAAQALGVEEPGPQVAARPPSAEPTDA